MTCNCIHCDECGGSGNVWVSFTGKYLGRSRCDDLDDLQTCDSCDGSGLFEMCDECREKEEQAEWEEENADEHSLHPTIGGTCNEVKTDYSKLADEFIEEGAWQGVPVIAVRMFARWIEEREAHKQHVRRL